MKQTQHFTEEKTRQGCTIRAIPAAGSDRRYFILSREDGRPPVVVTYGTDCAENAAFIALSRKLSEEVNVPVVIHCSEDLKYYSQTYVGGRSLFDYLESSRKSGCFKEDAILMLEKSMELIANIHSVNFSDFDAKYFYPKPRMDVRMVRFDLNYFKYCFLKLSGILFDEDKLQDVFDRLETLLMLNEPRWDRFMYRDFQSRNVMLSDDGKQLFGIDFQGGRIGPSEYDLASFLWQAKAAYPQYLKDRLLNYYLKYRAAKDTAFDPEEFIRDFNCFVLFRVMQTLGAYGFRGWVERRPHFLSSIIAGIRNLNEISSRAELRKHFPYIHELATALAERYDDIK